MHENDGTCVPSLAVSKNLLSIIYLSCVYISLVDQRKALYTVHRICPVICELFSFNYRFLNKYSKPLLKNPLLKNNTIVNYWTISIRL